MFRTVRSVCNMFADKWKNVKAFATAYDEFGNLLIGIADLQKAADKKTSGLTEDKGTARVQLVEYLLKIASAVFEYAVRSGNGELKAGVAFTYSDLTGAKEANLLTMAKNTYDIAVANLANLGDSNITQDNIDKLKQRIDDYEELVTAPRTTKVSTKTANAQIEEAMQKGTALLKERLDKLVVTLKDEAPEFYKAYFNARIIVNMGVRHGDAEEEPLPDTQTAA